MKLKTPTLEELKVLSPKLPEKIPYLKMLILFGSRARGDTHAKSDWDFAALYDEEILKTIAGDNRLVCLEVPLILGKLYQINPDTIDVVELNNCSWLIAHFIARDGILLYEKDRSGFEYFKLTSLRSKLELKKFRQEQRQLIKIELQKWGL
jgi:uncharacterized protein